MNVYTKNLSISPLKVSILLSVLLHATGFYIFSNTIFDLPSRSPDSIPVKVTALFKEKGMHPANLKNTPKQKQFQSTHSAKLISTAFGKIKATKPTPIYKNNFLLNHSTKQSQKRSPVVVNRMKISSSKKQSSYRISSKNFYSNKTSKIAPRFFEKSYDMQKNATSYSTITKNIGLSQKLTLSKTVKSRTSSNFQSNSNQSLNPAFMYKSSTNEKNTMFAPYVRKIDHNLSLNEEFMDSSQTTTMEKVARPSINLSSLELGELRHGFHKQVWQKVAKAKYYPRIARKRGFEGEPIVSFTIGRKGELIDLRLIEFSNYKLLNEAALETVRRGIPYPSIPKPLRRDSISFNLPISYVLK
jgi:TonB family protein